MSKLGNRVTLRATVGRFVTVTEFISVLEAADAIVKHENFNHATTSQSIVARKRIQTQIAYYIRHNRDAWEAGSWIDVSGKHLKNSYFMQSREYWTAP